MNRSRPPLEVRFDQVCITTQFPNLNSVCMYLVCLQCALSMQDGESMVVYTLHGAESCMCCLIK